jgi:transposase-like protein
MAEKKEGVEATVRTIRRVSRKKYSAEEKVRIVLEGLRGETNIAALCRREGIPSNLYYRWSKDFPQHEARAGWRPGSSAWWVTPSARQTAAR